MGPLFLLGHPFPLGLHSGRGTGEAILGTQDPVLTRKLTFCPVTARRKGQVSLAIAAWRNDDDDDDVITNIDQALTAYQGLCSVLYLISFLQ